MALARSLQGVQCQELLHSGARMEERMEIIQEHDTSCCCSHGKTDNSIVEDG